MEEMWFSHSWLYIIALNGHRKICFVNVKFYIFKIQERKKTDKTQFVREPEKWFVQASHITKCAG